MPVLFLPELVGLACGLSTEEMMLGWHAVPVNVRLQESLTSQKAPE
ncbi:MAG: hypothetical protein GY696_03915 [Gammaproteobacteria bacterium]|nr:hypothetical protein [Gammaproteobacteria bacterium]